MLLNRANSRRNGCKSRAVEVITELTRVLVDFRYRTYPSQTRVTGIGVRYGCIRARHGPVTYVRVPPVLVLNPLREIFLYQA